MTGFIGGSVASGVIAADDRRTLLQSYQMDQQELPEWQDRGYISPWWPRSSNEDESGVITAPDFWEQPELASGAVSRFGYRGVTRDGNNSPLAGVTVKIFRTSDDSKVSDDVVSDSNGNFITSTPYYEAHYLVMRKAGSPEVSGVTVSSQFPNT